MYVTPFQSSKHKKPSPPARGGALLRGHVDLDRLQAELSGRHRCPPRDAGVFVLYLGRLMRRMSHDGCVHYSGTTGAECLGLPL
eukprot:scaffold18682_cov144-Isochrysis_galbana.AAC.1